MISDRVRSGSSDLNHVSEPTLEAGLNGAPAVLPRKSSKAAHMLESENQLAVLRVPRERVREVHGADPQFHGPKMFMLCIRSWTMSLFHSSSSASEDYSSTHVLQASPEGDVNSYISCRAGSSQGSSAALQTLYSVHYLAIRWFPSHLIPKAEPPAPKYIQKSKIVLHKRIPDHRSFRRELFSEHA